MAKFVIKCFEAHYPECLGLCLVHKAPWLFQGVWKIIRGWLDPVVASKVHFTNDVADLQKYIAPECIIRELGGDEDWVYEEAVKRSGAPSTEENARLLDDAAREKIQAERTDLVMQYEVRTMDWVKGAMKPPDRALVAEKLKVNYWKLDPYVRAKSAYDRMGMLIEGGSVDFYPPGYSAPVTGGA